MLHAYYTYGDNLVSGVNLPNGTSQIRQHAAIAPADEPQSLFSKRYGAYVFKHDATPVWYIPKNPHPEKDTFMFGVISRNLYFHRVKNEKKH